MKNIIITIDRQYGSGGKYIGEQVAKELNIPFYDKEILIKACEKEGVSYAKLESNDEHAKSNIVKAFNLLNTNNYEEAYLDDTYQLLIRHTIEEIANNGSCVILGRNANNILKDNFNVINIYIYSNNLDFKIKRKMKLENRGYEEIAKKLKKIDNERKKYYESLNKDSVWGKIENYDYCLDSSVLGVDETAKLIADIYNKKQN